MSRLSKIINLIFIGFIYLSCDSNKVYERYVEIENAMWIKEKKVDFEIEAVDTLSPHNLYLNIRNTGNYPYSNIYLFITMRSPNGHQLRDTLNCKLADNRGKWLGKGIGDMWDLRIPYIGNFKFVSKGNYKITLEQAMRVEKGLEGISDIGLRVEKAD